VKSVRRYLLSRMLIGAGLILAGAGLVVYLIVAASLDRHFDQNLADRIQGFASILFQVDDELSFEFSDELMPNYALEKRPDYFELTLDDGQLVERSESLGEDSLELPQPVGPEPAFWNASLPDGRDGRFASQLLEVHHVYPEEGPDRPIAAVVSIVLACDTDPLKATKRAVLFQSFLAFGLLMALLALLCVLAVRRGLEPTRRLAQSLDEVRIDALPDGLDAGPLPEELAPMASKADALIRRVVQALERERRTTADIAHELRTPISEVLTVSEVALRGLADEGGGDVALETIRDIASHMGRSVSTLLKLAWLETGEASFGHTGVDLGGLVEGLLRGSTTQSQNRELRIVNEVPRGQLVEGDGDVLRIIVSNLLANALTYSPAGGDVAVSFESSGDEWTLSVHNQTDDLKPGDLELLADPFWRGDRARVDRSRFGLGLALSTALAERTGLKLGFELNGRRFHASLRGRDSHALTNGHGHSS